MSVWSCLTVCSVHLISMLTATLRVLKYFNCLHDLCVTAAAAAAAAHSVDEQVRPSQPPVNNNQPLLLLIIDLSLPPNCFNHSAHSLRTSGLSQCLPVVHVFIIMTELHWRNHVMPPPKKES